MTQRVIKFRAWDKYRKAMVTDFVMAPTSPDWAPFPIENSEEANKLLNDLDRKNGDPFGGDYTLTDWGNYYGIENLIVMQFTGLLDKHGKEIYEKDLIRWHDDIFRVEYDGGGFKGENITQNIPGYLSWEHFSASERIGDAYTTPELVDPKMIER